MTDEIKNTELPQEEEDTLENDLLMSEDAEKVDPKKAEFDRKVNHITLIETVLTFSWGSVLLIALVVTIISFMSGHRGMRVVIQTASITLVLGIILWIVSWMVAKGLFEIEKKLHDEENMIVDQNQMLGEDMPTETP